MTNSCIWAVLSIGELNFVNTSSTNNYLLKGQSLYQLIHPEEVALAKKDLSIFMNLNRIGGSITRCRLKDYTAINTNAWIIVDIIMYIATKDLVLAFFHHQPQQRQACGSHLVQLESRNTISLLKDSLIGSYARSPSLSPTNTSLCSSSSGLEDGLPNQFFYILDNHSKSVLLSWPDDYYYSNEELLLTNHRPISPTISCFRCVQKPERITSLEKPQRIQRYSPPVSPSSSNSRNIKSGPYLLAPVSNSNKQQQYASFHQQNHCHSCGTHSSPEWRRGPTGHKTLCNACGLRYSRSIARQVKTQKPYHYSPPSSTKRHHKQSIHFAIS